MLAALHGHDDAAVLMATEMAALGMHEALGAVDAFGDSIMSYAAYGGAVQTITYLFDRADLPDEALKAQLAAVNEVSDLVAAHVSTRHGVLLVRGCAALACALASCPAAGSVVPPHAQELVVYNLFPARRQPHKLAPAIFTARGFAPFGAPRVQDGLMPLMMAAGSGHDATAGALAAKMVAFEMHEEMAGIYDCGYSALALAARGCAAKTIAFLFANLPKDALKSQLAAVGKVTAAAKRCVVACAKAMALALALAEEGCLRCLFSCPVPFFAPCLVPNVGCFAARGR